MKNNKRFFSDSSRKSGFTLVELLVSIGLISLVAAYFVQYQLESVSRRLVESLAQDMLSISSASMAFYSRTMEWPDQDNNCAGLQATLVGNNAFPEGHTPVLGVTYAFDCQDSADYGRTLQIMATFPLGEEENDEFLRSYLPTSGKTEDDEERTFITHYISPPRKANNQYQFFKEELDGGTFRLTKPDCWGDQEEQYMLIPQSVCMDPSGPNARHGFGGFYFDELEGDETEESWRFRLRVAPGAEGSGLGAFYDGPSRCDGQNIEVGAIVYCR